MNKMIFRPRRSARPAPGPIRGFIGISGFTANEIEQMYAASEQTNVSGRGILIISRCDEEKLFSVVRSINVLGWVFCSERIGIHYGLH